MNRAKQDEAVEAVREELAKVAGIRSVILYGSVARGIAEPESDIDLLIECEEGTEDEVRGILNRLADRLGLPFSPVFFRTRERARFDTQFLESILRHGQPLIGGLPALTPQELDLQPLRLVSYRTQRLSPRRRAVLLRILDGYRSEKEVRGKRYVVEKEGFLKRVGGWRVGRGALVVPEEASGELDAILRHFGATRSMVAIWCQRP